MRAKISNPETRKKMPNHALHIGLAPASLPPAGERNVRWEDT